MEKQVRGEIHEVCATLKRPRRDWSPTELAYIADLPHVVAHWHDDRAYIDEYGVPKLLPFDGPDASLSRLIARVYANRPVETILQTLLRSGVVRRRGKSFEVTSRNIVFPPSAGAYLHGLIALLGILRTLQTNLAGERKLLQQTAINSQVPVRELPALYDAIRKRVLPVLIATDVDMMRRESRAGPREPLTRVGVSIHVFEDRDNGKALALEAPSGISRKRRSRPR